MCWRGMAVPTDVLALAAQPNIQVGFDSIAREAHMRARIVGLLLAMNFMPQFGSATDVGYRLETHCFTAIDEPKVGELSSIEIKDRVWAAPGIEDSFRQLEPPRIFDFQAKQRFRIEGPGGSPPDWLDDVAWPRTRELWGLGRSDVDGDPRMEFTFGGITLQR